MIVIIDYNIGNTGSVVNALDKLGIPNQISRDSLALKRAKGLILPGVGAAGKGMKNLCKLGLINIIKEEISKGKPFLGICLGMQLLFEQSSEGNVPCLALFKGSVKKFEKEKRIPQIGWNRIKNQISKIKNQKFKSKIKKLFRGIKNNSYFYFVNSYYCEPEDKSIVVGTSVYGEEFASVIVKNNIVATQFHPEKSGQAGFQLLKNFIKTYVN